MIPENVMTLDGRDVLVRQTAPPFPGTAITLRGVLRVVDAPDPAAPSVTIALSFPSVFTSAQEEYTLHLSDDEVEALLATEHDGAYEHTLQGSFDDLRTRVPVATVMKPRVVGWSVTDQMSESRRSSPPRRSEPIEWE